MAWGVGVYGAGTFARSHIGLGARCDVLSQGAEWIALASRRGMAHGLWAGSEPVHTRHGRKELR